MIILHTFSSRETRRRGNELGKRYAALARGEVFALSGPLGAGKTTFAQGFLRAFGVRHAPSSTFVLMRTYRIKRRTFHHIDCYRVRDARAARAAGIADALRDPRAIALVEWAEQIRGLLPRRAIRLAFRYGETRRERIIRITGLPRRIFTGT